MPNLATLERGIVVVGKFVGVEPGSEYSKRDGTKARDQYVCILIGTEVVRVKFREIAHAEEAVGDLAEGERIAVVARPRLVVPGTNGRQFAPFIAWTGVGA